MCDRKTGGVSGKHKEDHCMEKLPIISPNLSLGLLTLFMVPIVIQTFQNFNAIKCIDLFIERFCFLWCL